MNPYFLAEPLFEIGPKAYIYGDAALEMAVRADELAEELKINVIFTPQTVDIFRIARQTRHLKIFAQHMDPIHPGRGMGAALPEALKAAGAYGTFLNHAERKLTLSEISLGILRAHEAGLCALVCANDGPEAMAVASLHPDILIVESDAQIGSSDGYHALQDIQKVRREVASIDPEIQILFGAGIKTEEDVCNVIRAGAAATGCTSAIMCAEQPLLQMEKMLRALRSAWDSTKNKEN